jgi:branched-chain amino acid transport system permease protein
MKAYGSQRWIYGSLLVFGIIAPFLFPNYTAQLTVWWVMVLFALTWDISGGQMGYNSLGNILFFGVGMYASTIVQIGLYYDVAAYTASVGAIKVDFTSAQYFTGLGLGIITGGIVAVVFAVVLGGVVFGLRGPYFAIGTLGMGLAAAELVASWEYVGGGGGVALPVYPGHPDERSLMFYYISFILATLTILLLMRIYSSFFGIAANAIRDDEEKAEAMGVHTLRYKIVGWAIAAFFLGMTGAVFGNMIGFIEPVEVAFPAITFGIFMVVMSLLGGKGTLLGPIIGATVFHLIKELTWTYMLGWQWVALGALIIVIVVFFQQGMIGWAQEKWPEKFGIIVDEDEVARETELEVKGAGRAAE